MTSKQCVQKDIRTSIIYLYEPISNLLNSFTAEELNLNFHHNNDKKEKKTSEKVIKQRLFYHKILQI